MKYNDLVQESFQNVSINGVLYSLNTDEKKIYTKAKEAGKLMKNDLSEFDQRIANGLVTRGLLKRRKNPQHELYFMTKGRRKCAIQKPLDEVAPPDSGIEKWIEDNKERFQERYGKEYKKYLYGKAWNKFNGKKMVKESADDRPQICRDMEKAFSDVGDIWKNNYNHKEYKVSDVVRKKEHYDDCEINVPYYILTLADGGNDARECSDYILHRDYTMVSKYDRDENDDEEYWDGEEDEDNEQLDEGWHYKIDVNDISYDLPSSDYFQLDFDDAESEDDIDLSDAVSSEINDRAEGPIYDYNWEIDEKWSDDEDDEEENDPMDDTKKEDFWDGEENIDTQTNKEIQEVLKNAGIQINEDRADKYDRLMSLDSPSAWLSKELYDTLKDNEYFKEAYENRFSGTIGFEEALKHMCEVWSEEYENFTMDRKYQDVSWIQIKGVILNSDEIYEDWESWLNDDDDSEKYGAINTADEWDGEEDEDEEITESSEETKKEPKYKEGDVLVHNEKAKEFKGNNDYEFIVKEVMSVENTDEPWYVLSMYDSENNYLRDTAAFAENVIDKYFIKFSTKEDDDWDGEEDEDNEQLDEEITPSRLWQYQESDKIDFAILSADRSERSEEENEEKNKELKKDIKDMGYWYTELKGGYIEISEIGERVPVDGENSLLVPNMKRDEAIELGKKYDQDSVMFKDSKRKTLEYIVTNERNGNIGDTDSSFETQAGRDNFSVSKGSDLDYYSRLHKSNKPDLKIGFNWKG